MVMRVPVPVSKAARQALRRHAGQELALIPKGKGVRVVPVPEWAQLQGVAKGARRGGYRDRKD